MNKKIGIFIFFFFLIASFQNCGEPFHANHGIEGDDSSNYPSGTTSRKAQCTQETAPRYRASLLTRQEIIYTFWDLFHDEVNRNRSILNFIDKIPKVAVDVGADKTIYSSNNSMNMEHEIYLTQLIEAGDLLAEEVYKRTEVKSACSNKVKCFEVMSSLIERVWRRPLTSEEASNFQDIFSRDSPALDDIKIALMTTFASPQFYIKNYVKNNGNSVDVEYTQYELASRLSFFLYDSVPDTALYEAAQRGELIDGRSLTQHVDRLLSNEKFLDRFIENTLSYWLGVTTQLSSTEVLTNDKGVKLAVKEMAEQQRERLKIIFKENRKLSEVYNSAWEVTNYNIANYMGWSTGGLGSEFVKIDKEDSSYFNSPYFAYMSKSKTHGDKTTVVDRGLLAMSMFCVNIPVNEVNPADITRVLGPHPEKLLQTQVGVLRSRHVSCKGCHGEMDKLGMGLEQIGPYGKKRWAYKDGKAIRFSFKLGEDQNEYATNFGSFSKQFSQDQRLSQCFTRSLANKISPMTLTSRQPCFDNLADQTDSHESLKDRVRNFVISRVFNKVIKE